ncbi:MAG TPA: sialidase family protein [Candidatus Limnocylindrales bacterium]
MTFHDDPDLERRLRHIADAPQPPVPGSVFEYAGKVTREKRGFKMRFSLGFPFGRGPARLASGLAIAAVLVVAVALAGVLISERSNQAAPSSSNSPSSSPTGSGGPSASDSALLATETPHALISAGTPGPTLTNLSLLTPGVATGWQGFSWTKLAANSPLIPNPDLSGSGVRQVLKWQGGYAATGSTPGRPESSSGLWFSPDGQDWTPAHIGLTEPSVMVAVAPVGLIVIGVDASGTPQPVWTTSDGHNWKGSSGVSNLPGSLVSIAGTSTGIVATVAVTSGSGKAATTNYLIEYSTDGEHWSAETVGPGVTFDAHAPTVQADAGRFFLLGSTASPVAQAGGEPGVIFASSNVSPSYVWWSDDGRTWTRSGGSFQAAPQRIDFGRDGMLLETSWNAVPGGTELARSTDAGKTWTQDAKFGPLGPATCSGACSTGPDGAIGSNGTVFVAVKNGGKQAWTSFDGATWTPISWAGPDPSSVGLGSLVVLPRGVLAGDMYGAAK